MPCSSFDATTMLYNLFVRKMSAGRPSPPNRNPSVVNLIQSNVQHNTATFTLHILHPTKDYCLFFFRPA
jgi:hypothetical protein